MPKGRLPKPEHARRRRNLPAGFDALPAEGYSGDFPPLPDLYMVRDRRVRYLKATREWYGTWARSPQATRFTGPAWRKLLDLAPLRDALYRDPTNVKLAAELRLQEQGFGPTPMDLLRNRQVVAVGDEAGQDPADDGDGPPPEVRRLFARASARPRAVDPALLYRKDSRD